MTGVRPNKNELNGHTARTKENPVYDANLGLTPESKTPEVAPERARPRKPAARPQATANSSEHVHLAWNMPVGTSFEHFAEGASKRLSSVKPN